MGIIPYVIEELAAASAEEGKVKLNPEGRGSNGLKVCCVEEEEEEEEEPPRDVEEEDVLEEEKEPGGCKLS